jgi:hypothetical protein
MNDIFQGVGIKIDILNPDNFNKIKETLTRIGVAAKNEKKLFQSCHILHKRDRSGNSCYAIVHFKEMFKLDGRPSDFSQSDLDRTIIIAKLLEDWNLLKIIECEKDLNVNSKPPFKVISFADKGNWHLIPKYRIGG